MVEQRTIHFAGQVQGVGFRYAACRTAGEYDVTGYVRNMPDGSVQCIVEGERQEIDAFFEDLDHRMKGYIRHVSQQTAPASGLYPDFGVRY